MLILAPLLPWEFEIVYRVTVGLIAWLTLSSIPMSGNGIEKSIALWKMKRMLLTNSFQGISPWVMAQSSKCCFESSVALGTAQDLQEMTSCITVTGWHHHYMIYMSFIYEEPERRHIRTISSTRTREEGASCWPPTNAIEKPQIVKGIWPYPSISMISCSDYNTPAETAWDQLDWTNKLHAPWYFAIPPDRIFWLVLISSD